MWANPVMVWISHGVVAGGGILMIIAETRLERALTLVALMAFRIFWSRRLIKCAADAKLAEAFRVARERCSH